MASAKSGKGGSAVAPAAPEEAKAADNADPGEISEAKAKAAETGKGKYAPVTTKAFKPPTPEEAKVKTSWIEIELIDEADQPVPGEAYKVTLPDGSTVAEGTLDHKGFARIEGIDPGTCKVTFPRLDKEAWEKA
ncbi:MAG: hypothetical protein ACOYN0_04190 [Phycisphaerales bacterium]